VWSATFLHAWVGRAQWTDGGSPLLAPLGTRWTGAPTSSGPAAWASGGPLPAHAGLQCALAEVLVAPRWGMLADGESTALGGHPVEYAALLAEIQAEVDGQSAEVKQALAGDFGLGDVRGRVNI
jgi:hypothetical protein